MFAIGSLTANFWENKTKSILFASKHKIESAGKLNVKYKNIKIKDLYVTYLGCILDETLYEELMDLKALNKINGKLKRFYRKHKFVTPTLRRMLCNAIVQLHFDYACSAWYPNLNENAIQIQIVQSKCVRFCLMLDKRHQISSKGCESINWLPVNKRVYQCINAITFKSVNDACPIFLREIYEYAPQCRIESRSNSANLKVPFWITNMRQNGLSYIGSSLWNNLPGSLKKTVLNTFKHNLKKKYLSSFAES